ncbi:hypothetical protein CAter282_0608 [Collimonas arenae]|uniref:Uncharacterized protein n=1 Tax=Collimonas arenae TaxID=279058 RepID=A0A127QEC8_9BURK|nr:hypothetical protein [Collimonas arenae]AMO98531.1 hypothetical protein CAter10_0647 [Collimonas arenae]AMP08417.1 hypothetical protein CAter282_0608 [Collimonas arenae]
MNKLDISEICERIAVQAPYFAFTELCGLPDRMVQGTFSSEQPLGFENGPVASAEIGRHLAILGSCAAVAWQPAPQIYYLATKARYSKLHDVAPREPGAVFQASAEVLQQDRRSLTAQAIVSAEKPFAHLYCEYQALSESVFLRLFKDYHVPSTPSPAPFPEDSPYRQSIQLDFDAPVGHSLVAHSQPLAPTRCAGHFLDYPAWPVAIMVHTVAQTTSRLLHHIVEREASYTVVKCDLSAYQLVPASEPLSFHTRCVSASAYLSHYVFETDVMRNGEIVSSVATELQI